MKSLNNIIAQLDIDFTLHGNDQISIANVTQKVEEVEPNSLFFAVKGLSVDGHDFIVKAIQKGATCVVCQQIPPNISQDITWIVTSNTRSVMGPICGAFFDFPSLKLNLVGVTGTNGKSSVATMLFQLFTHVGHECGLIATTGYVIGEKQYDSTHTTPDPVRLNQLLAEMVQANCTHVFMEVSSIAVDQGRINGLHFKGAVFTNITHDHLDYHLTFANYIKAKKTWFDNLEHDAFALVNSDDKNGSVMLQNCNAARYTYALQKMADFTVQILEKDFEGMLLKVANHEIWVKQVGKFNAYNLAAVYGTAFLMGMPEDQIVVGLSTLHGAKGRFEIMRHLYPKTKITGILDYAHTPDALKNVLLTTNDIRTGNEKLIVVLGCGGDRDKAKRPLMGEIAAKLADVFVLTSDNPRSENPETIMCDVEAGIHPLHVKKVLKITDRKQAIHAAVAIANPGDVILVAGKGHENYQEMNGQKLHFDDKEVFLNALHLKSDS
jgi:UDP-N-acetylmuramoyl-L-alanyl-D-glutamate--2,6-diaminopimelate ligase